MVSVSVPRLKLSRFGFVDNLDEFSVNIYPSVDSLPLGMPKCDLFSVFTKPAPQLHFIAWSKGC